MGTSRRWRTAFASGDARASGIVDLWYEGEPKQRFYDHTDSIEWTEPPTIDASGDLVMAGKAEPGAVSVDWEEGTCSQFYVVDAKANFEHTIERRLPSNRKWTKQVNEIVEGEVRTNGEFKARVKLLVTPIGDWSLVVWAKTEVSDGLCHRSLVLSEIQVSAN